MAAAHGAAGQPPQAPQAPAFTPYPDTKLSPCVRLVEYTMDNTCGTNKSQFMFGALATAPLRGYVDAIKIEFMVVGHTKMRLDNAFSATGNAFRKNDVFNLGMLCNLFSPYFDVRAYDDRLLKSFRSGTPAIFTDIRGITSWRSFMIVGDDGLLNLTTSPDGTIAHAVLMKAVGDLEERSLAVVLEAVVEGTGYHGIGDETGLYGPKINRLFPLRRVRLFYRPTEGVGPWCEYSGYQKTTDATAIEAALSCIIPFKGSRTFPRITRPNRSSRRRTGSSGNTWMISSRSTFHPTAARTSSKFQRLVVRAPSTGLTTQKSSQPSMPWITLRTTTICLSSRCDRRKERVGRIWPPPGIRSNQSHPRGSPPGRRRGARTTTTRSSWRPWIARPTPQGS